MLAYPEIKISFENSPGIEWQERVKERAQYIQDCSRDKYYDFTCMMIWIAQETQSVISKKNTVTNEFTFYYVGI